MSPRPPALDQLERDMERELAARIALSLWLRGDLDSLGESERIRPGGGPDDGRIVKARPPPLPRYSTGITRRPGGEKRHPRCASGR
jgi:hypothetical protein